MPAIAAEITRIAAPMRRAYFSIKLVIYIILIAIFIWLLEAFSDRLLAAILPFRMLDTWPNELERERVAKMPNQG